MNDPRHPQFVALRVRRVQPRPPWRARVKAAIQRYAETEDSGVGIIFAMALGLLLVGGFFALGSWAAAQQDRIYWEQEYGG